MALSKLTLKHTNITYTYVSDNSYVFFPSPKVNVVDGNLSTSNIITNNQNAIYITYTFSPNTDGIHKQRLGALSITENSNFRDFDIELSTDGVNYTVAHSIEDRAEFSTRYDLPFNNVRYKSFRFKITDFNGSNTSHIYELIAYTYSEKKYNVEFNDSILDLDGWKKPRYEGSKLIGSQVNKFKYGINPISSKRNKILTNTEDTLYAYGPKPVIERKSTALFIGNNIQQGDINTTDNVVVDIKNHSYVSVDKIIILNPNSTKGKDAIVEVITKESMDSDSFNQLLIDNCPEGSKVKIRLLDREISNTLKNSYSVKFNRGTLMKIYSYTADTASGTDDGVFGGYGIRSNQGSLPDNLTSGSTNLSSSGLFGFGMTAFASHSRFTSSITMINNLPSELSLYNTEINNIIELNPITASGTNVIPTSPIEGGNYDIDNTQNFAL